MSEKLPVSDEAVEAAATMWWNQTDPGPYPDDDKCREQGYPDRDDWHNFLLAAYVAEGFGVEWDGRYRTKGQDGRLRTTRECRRRLVGPWLGER